MRTTISAGALALALGGGIPVFVAAPVSAAAQIDDCEHGGLLGTVTGGVCQAVDSVGDIVSGLTSAVTTDADTLGSIVETPAAGVGATSSATKPEPDSAASSPPPPSERNSEGGLLPTVLDEVCLPLVGSAECPGPSATSTPGQRVQPSGPPSPSPSRSQKPEPSPKEKAPSQKKTVPLPAESPLPPETRTLTTDVGEPVTPKPSPVIDAEAPRVELLWPGPLMQEFQRQMPGKQPMTPSKSSDPLGTTLTTALLIAAILAVRLLYGKRTGEESMPFEPVRVGRHRVA